MFSYSERIKIYKESYNEATNLPEVSELGDYLASIQFTTRLVFDDRRNSKIYLDAVFRINKVFTQGYFKDCFIDYAGEKYEVINEYHSVFLDITELNCIKSGKY